MPEALRPIELGPNECIWIDDAGSPWLVKATFARVGERMEVVGMEVRSVRNPGEDRLAKHLPEAGSGEGSLMSSKVWRSTGALAADIRHHYFNALDQSGLLSRAGNESAAAAWRAPKDEVEARLMEVAAVYEAAVAADQNPTLAVSTHFSLSRSAAAKRIQRARQKGLLPTTTTQRSARLQH